jgi:peptidoglycan/xylan/chitin deacetylase (PgdA/CDA1 family)
MMKVHPWVAVAWTAAMMGVVGTAGCRRPAAPVAPAPAAPAVEEVVVVEPDPGEASSPGEAPLNAQAAELKIKKSAQVSVLCYHDFTTGKSNNPMVINIEHFRRQMQTLRDARMPVISMDDYLAWRRGEKDIPDPSVMITIDDGWKSTLTLAHPVLRDFGYPYTLFLYKNYVDGGGRALKTDEIRKLLAEGVTIGSHSVSHPYPPDFRRRAKGPPAEYEAWLDAEFRESKAFLESKFGVKITTFAYPGGHYTPEMAKRGTTDWGYQALFTCNPVRTSWDTPIAEIGRFIIFGNDEKDRNFKAATSFGGGLEDLGRQLLGGEPGDDGAPQAPLVVVTPGENETVTDRRPLITVDLSKLTDIDPASVVMRMPGFGEVPATFDAATGRLVYRPISVLRQPEVGVHVRMRRKGQGKDDTVSWKFFIDQKAHYRPRETAAADGAPAAAGEGGVAAPVATQ